MELSRRSKALSSSVVIGKIVGVHGIKGEVKLALDYPEVNFTIIKKVLLQNRAFFVESFRGHKKNILLKLKTIDDRNSAEKLRELPVSVNNDYLAQETIIKNKLIGLKVFNISGELLGEVISLLKTPAHDIIVVQNQEKELLIPYVDNFVKEISNKVIVNINNLEEFTDD